MKQLLEDKKSVAVMVVATALLALSYLLNACAYITISALNTVMNLLNSLFSGNANSIAIPYMSPATSYLAILATWLLVLAALACLIRVGNLAFSSVAGKNWRNTAELIGMAVSFLIITIGFLVAAINVNGILNGSIIVAVGIGLFSLLLLYKATELSIEAQRREEPSPPETRAWLLGFFGVLSLAIGYAVLSDASGGAAWGVLFFCLGFGAILGAIAIAYQNDQFSSRSTVSLGKGLLFLTATSLLAVMLEGIAFPNSWLITATTTQGVSLFGFQITGVIVALLFTVGYGILSYTAFRHYALMAKSTANDSVVSELQG